MYNIKYVILSESTPDYVSVTMVLDIIGHENSLNPIMDQEKELIKNFGMSMTNTNVSVYTEQEFKEKVQKESDILTILSTV